MTTPYTLSIKGSGHKLGLKDFLMLPPTISRHDTCSQILMPRTEIEQPIRFVCVPNNQDETQAFWYLTKAVQTMIGRNGYLKREDMTDTFLITNKDNVPVIEFLNALIPEMGTNIVLGSDKDFEFKISGDWFEFHEESEEGKKLKETYDEWMEYVPECIKSRIHSQF